MNQPLRVGVIGANPKTSWAKDAHIPAIRGLEGLELAAVATSSRETAEAAGRAFEVAHVYDDALALARAEGIDIVSVCVKVPHHRDLVLAALAAGKHVFCEWPLGKDLAEAEELAAAARKARGHVAIGLQAHFSTAARRAAALLREGAIGRPLTSHVFASTGGFGPELPSPYAYLNDVRTGANLLTIMGGHTLDLVTAVLGGFASLNALTTTQFEQVKLVDKGETIPRTVPDHILLLARAANGCAVSVEVDGNRQEETPFRFEIRGTKGTLALTGGHSHGFQAGRLELWRDGEVLVKAAEESPDLPTMAVNVAATYTALRDDIREGRAGEQRVALDFDHAARLTRLLTDVTAASKDGHRREAQGWPG